MLSLCYCLALSCTAQGLGNGSQGGGWPLPCFLSHPSLRKDHCLPSATVFPTRCAFPRGICALKISKPSPKCCTPHSTATSWNARRAQRLHVPLPAIASHTHSGETQPALAEKLRSSGFGGASFHNPISQPNHQLPWGLHEGSNCYGKKPLLWLIEWFLSTDLRGFLLFPFLLFPALPASLDEAKCFSELREGCCSLCGAWLGWEHLQQTTLIIWVTSNNTKLLRHSLHLRSAVQAL